VGSAATAVHTKHSEWLASLPVRACACSRRGPQRWVVRCLQPLESSASVDLAASYDAVCSEAVFPPWRSSLCHPPADEEGSDSAQRIADQHGNMIQVCLLLLGTAFWGGDRIGASDPRFVVVDERKARKAQRLRILQVPTLWPPCRVTAGVRGGGRRRRRWWRKPAIEVDDPHFLMGTTNSQLQAERSDSCAWLGKGKHGKAEHP
jgi:hypothetical protein